MTRKEIIELGADRILEELDFTNRKSLGVICIQRYEELTGRCLLLSESSVDPTFNRPVTERYMSETLGEKPALEKDEVYELYGKKYYAKPASFFLALVSGKRQRQLQEYKSVRDQFNLVQERKTKVRNALAIEMNPEREHSLTVKLSNLQKETDSLGGKLDELEQEMEITPKLRESFRRLGIEI